MTFLNNGSEAMRIDTANNLGIGVTPSAWVNATASQVGFGAAISSRAAGSTASDMSHAAYWNGTNWLYQSSSVGAARYQMTGANAGSTHAWFTSVGGTAGNTISFTQAMTLDASGRLLVGTTSSYLSQFKSVVEGATSGSATLALGLFKGGTPQILNGDVLGNLYFYGVDNDISAGNDNLGGRIHVEATTDWTSTTTCNAAMVFSTHGNTSGAPSERARITSGGYFKASNDGTYPYSATGAHEIKQTANTTTLFLTNTNTGFTTNLLQVECSTAAGTGWNFARFFANGSAQAEIRGDGNLYNTNGTYGTISDARLKQDIADAPSQWGDIKAIQFRKYRMKADVEANPDAPELLGVVAQELEQTSPGLVDEGSDGIKSVKSSILLMKAAVALQEAMTRIEQLEAKVAALEAK